jgi:hypothetical protein
MRKMHNALLL